MISELERYQGVVFRQLVVGATKPLNISVADHAGRIDCFRVEQSAFQIKYSTKRLSPWQFSFTIEQLNEIAALTKRYGSVWMMLVCGIDGVVALRATEFASITESRPGGVASVRVSRSRNSMYRVTGNARELPFAKARGVEEFLNEAMQWAQLAVT